METSVERLRIKWEQFLLTVLVVPILIDDFGVLLVVCSTAEGSIAPHKGHTLMRYFRDTRGLWAASADLQNVSLAECLNGVSTNSDLMEIRKRLSIADQELTVKKGY